MQLTIKENSFLQHNQSWSTTQRRESESLSILQTPKLTRNFESNVDSHISSKEDSIVESLKNLWIQTKEQVSDKFYYTLSVRRNLSLNTKDSTEEEGRI